MVIQPEQVYLNYCTIFKLKLLKFGLVGQEYNLAITQDINCMHYQTVGYQRILGFKKGLLV